MIIKKIQIENFRSYYKRNVLELSDGLNIIIGSNGDGKTTLFDALEWLFNTKSVSGNSTMVSKKRLEELDADESDYTRVAITYVHDNYTKILEKKFRFTKSFDNQVTISDHDFSLIYQDGVERDVRKGINFDYDLPAEIRKYSMFKGETDLDIFQSTNALQLLIDTFSDVRDFDAYFSFMKYAEEKSSIALSDALKKDGKNKDAVKKNQNIIDSKKKRLAEIDRDLDSYKKRINDYSKFLKDIEKNKEASNSIETVNRRIGHLEEEKAKAQRYIDEDYTIKLLDDMWILLGFESVADEYSAIVGEIDLKKRKLEQDYLAETVADRVIKSVKTNFTPLPVHIPGREIMQEMLDEEICKICGRPAKMHSEPWEFMKERLDEYLNSLHPVADEPIPSLYQNDYIGELQKKNTILNDNLSRITSLKKVIKDQMCFNEARHEEVKVFETKIEREIEQKKRILAQTDGATEEQLLSAYTQITNWVDGQDEANRNIKGLESEKSIVVGEIEDAMEKLKEISKESTASYISSTHTALSMISKAFNSAKETNKNKLISHIEDEANRYLSLLNVNDFKGTIRIILKSDGTAEAALVDNDLNRIHNPNTALKTTMCMSILFSIAKLSSEKREKEYPLIFDAPTSSFTDKKESEFFDVISGINKQVVIVTKSFLKDMGNGRVVIDQKMVNSINGRVFRIAKKEPFDDKKLSTIQTEITLIR